MARSLLEKFDLVKVRHIPRLKNQEENDLAQITFGCKVPKEKLEELIKFKGKLVLVDAPSLKATLPKPPKAKILGAMKYIKAKEYDVLAIDNMSPDDWCKPIIEYLENPIGNTYQRIKYRELSYTITSNKLFKKTLEGILLKCLSENELYLTIFDVHSGLMVRTRQATK